MECCNEGWMALSRHGNLDHDAQNRSMQLSWAGPVGVASARNHGVVPGLAVACTSIQDASVLTPCGLGKHGLAQPSEVDS